ncbi:MAG: hypothetical protein GY757_07260 [bacterium]|nr:hypothetical protein [bacterium]
MTDNSKLKIDDTLISSVVGSVRYNLPEALDQKVTAAMNEEESADMVVMGGFLKSKWKKVSQWFDWNNHTRFSRVYVSAAAAAVLVIISLLIFLPKSSTQPVIPIEEIKTEFELKDKNIRILWVQKKDFQFRRNE